jgi:benzoyl-CoA 2,3-epoxidase subunit B
LRLPRKRCDSPASRLTKEDLRLQRALGKWLPNYLAWWREMGPAGFQEKDVYLRTAFSVASDGWAHFDYVKMPDYRWGIFLVLRD